ncbi:MAG: putative bifunctional diguanylate cyclase/phosphodiesterase, partial [Dehalococcoidia bacterium]
NMDRALERARQTGSVIGVLFLDLDDFKIVNDTYGHDYGDRLLRAVSERLTATLRPNDTAARLGGDEFAALVEGAPDAADVDSIAERVVAELAKPFLLDDRVVSGQASVGGAVSDGTVNGQDLLRHADLALYAAKRAGTGQRRRYHRALHTAMVQRLELRTALDQAITDRSLTLRFQPIVALQMGTTAGFEALVRWPHVDRGVLLPDQFIEVAEETGLIVPMGEMVLREACAAAARWRSASGSAESPYVSINVSARQFRTAGFVASVRSALQDTALPADRLMLELTESLLLRDDDQVWEDLAELRRAGVRIAIDDFGTGYSSLSYLRHVPLDALKIDRLFTSTITSSAKQAALVNGIVTLAHTLGLEVIAEGVELPAEREMLTRFACDYGQGFHFARPLSAAGAMAWVQAAMQPALVEEALDQSALGVPSRSAFS